MEIDLKIFTKYFFNEILSFLGEMLLRSNGHGIKNYIGLELNVLNSDRKFCRICSYRPQRNANQKLFWKLITLLLAKALPEPYLRIHWWPMVARWGLLTTLVFLNVREWQRGFLIQSFLSASLIVGWRPNYCLQWIHFTKMQKKHWGQNSITKNK